MPLRTASVAAAVLLFAGSAQAGILGIPTADGGVFEKLFDPRHFFPDRFRCEDGLHRAGHPERIAPWARPGYGRFYSAYYVGGGAPFRDDTADRCHGEYRYLSEGTFGVDYAPPWSRVRLWWYHGERYQAGEGQYAPDDANNPFARFFGR